MQSEQSVYEVYKKYIKIFILKWKFEKNFKHIMSVSRSLRSPLFEYSETLK